MPHVKGHPRKLGKSLTMGHVKSIQAQYMKNLTLFIARYMPLDSFYKQREVFAEFLRHPERHNETSNRRAREIMELIDIEMNRRTAQAFGAQHPDFRKAVSLRKRIENDYDFMPGGRRMPGGSKFTKSKQSKWEDMT